ncbi:hypothetical protein [Dactylosporangium matsuzakiense]|uniref:hypothetical protein n=1 Tax=Dactylosporangium matsuzakiense TaxID=53360 RepID=UPI0031E670B1
MPGYTAPTFPYTLPATDGMKAPVASMDSGNLVAFFEAIDIRHHYTTATAAPVDAASRVHRRAARGRLQTVLAAHERDAAHLVDVKPRKRAAHILYWPLSHRPAPH